MPSKGKPAKSSKPGASPKTPEPAKKTAPKPNPKPIIAQKAKSPVPKPAVKATAPPGKVILKKKTSPSEAKTSSVRRSITKTTASKPEAKPAAAAVKPLTISDVPQEGEIKHSVFVKIAKQKLLDLKDSLMDSMTGTASETLRNKAEGSEASAFGMHQADAGTDAYDRDFALSLLSQEQDALYEIEEALKRITAGTYGVCEMSNKRIPQARLEAIPFARFTIECQQQYEKEVGPNSGRRQVRSLFGLMGSEDEDEDSEEESSDNEKES
jgi:DnaK suppressor protein